MKGSECLIELGIKAGLVDFVEAIVFTKINEVEDVFLETRATKADRGF